MFEVRLISYFKVVFSGSHFLCISTFIWLRAVNWSPSEIVKADFYNNKEILEEPMLNSLKPISFRLEPTGINTTCNFVCFLKIKI